MFEPTVKTCNVMKFSPKAVRRNYRAVRVGPGVLFLTLTWHPKALSFYPKIVLLFIHLMRR